MFLPFHAKHHFARKLPITNLAVRIINEITAKAVLNYEQLLLLLLLLLLLFIIIIIIVIFLL